MSFTYRNSNAVILKDVDLIHAFSQTPSIKHTHTAEISYPKEYVHPDLNFKVFESRSWRNELVFFSMSCWSVDRQNYVSISGISFPHKEWKKNICRSYTIILVHTFSYIVSFCSRGIKWNVTPTHPSKKKSPRFHNLVPTSLAHMASLCNGH